MDAFIFAADAVLPILLTVVIGYVLKRIKLCDITFAKILNKICFRVFLPVMLAYNLYSGGGVKSSDLEIVAFVAVACVVMFALGLLIVTIFIKDPAQKGVVLQCAFRSNFAIIGLPLAQSIAGDEGARLAAVASAISIPIFNVFAVISLSVFRKKDDDGKKVSVWEITHGIITNPLIIGIAAGLLMLGFEALLGTAGANFRFSEITPVYSLMKSLTAVTSPMALIALGAQFEFSSVKKMFKPIAVGTVSRLVIMPTLVLGAAYLLFPNFSAAHFAMLLALSGSPVAVSSAIMAGEMKADSELAGQLVIATTLGSCITVFIASAIFKSVGIF